MTFETYSGLHEVACYLSKFFMFDKLPAYKKRSTRNSVAPLFICRLIFSTYNAICLLLNRSLFCLYNQR